MTPLVATATDDLWKAWSFDPLVLAGAVVAVAFFAQGWRRLRRRRPELAPWSRWPLFLAGVAVVVLGIVSPLDAIAEEYLQSAHMLQHVLIADLGVALALVAVRGPLSMFFLPRDLLAPLARRQALRRVLSFLLRPRVAVAALARRPRRMASPRPVRRGAPASARAPPGAPLARGRGRARLDAHRRPCRARAPERQRAHRARGTDALDRPDARVRVRLLVPPVLRRLRGAAGAAVRALPAHGPEARRRRDDGRAGAHARHRARPAAAGGPSRARAAEPRAAPEPV